MNINFTRSFKAIALWLMLVFPISACMPTLATNVDKETPHYSDSDAQKATMSVMYSLRTILDLFIQEYGKAPATLDLMMNDKEYFIKPENRNNFKIDGWGRPIIYLSNGTDYCLISLGKNGIFEDKQVDAGGLSPKGDYDAEIVLINGKWAVSPAWIGRS
jgi:hypothetical protein